MSSISSKIRLVTTVIGVGLFSSQCTSLKNNHLGPQASFQQEPIVEAYLEYPGPRRLWAGPQTFILHISLKDGESPSLAVTPAYFQNGEPSEVNSKVLAKADSGDLKKDHATESKVQREIASETHVKSKGWTNDEAEVKETGEEKLMTIGREIKMPLAAAREELTDIVDAFSDEAPPAKQTTSVDANLCNNPVKLKLIRSSGAVIEKYGCRGTEAWTQVMSEAASRFLAAAAVVQ